jgi:mannose-6-phosphate isomerase-like protein (cupin superfamily)
VNPVHLDLSTADSYRAIIDSSEHVLKRVRQSATGMERESMPEYRWTEARASEAIPPDAESRFSQVFTHGTLRLGLYAPRGMDPQQPHDQDEVYIILRGNGWFVNGEERHEFGPGDALFVPAGVEHRFEDFTDDLAVWVVFYGPTGGESSDIRERLG